MTGIALPGHDRLPPGPHRDLVEAVHELYRGAGLPSLRRIAAAINDGSYRDTISHEKAGHLLRGTNLPGWLKVECVVRQLAVWHNPYLDPDEQATRFLQLWLAAGAASPPGAPAHAAATDAAANAQSTSTSLPPPELGPTIVRGREGIAGRLLRSLDPQCCPGRPQVLAGVAGIGKSAIACSLAARVGDAGGLGRVWWISAADEEQFSRDLASLAGDLGICEADRERMRTHPVADLGEVADQVWARLEREPPGWLLIIDNADSPRLIGPQDGTGWIRPATCGLVLVTTRESGNESWPGADLIEVGPLPASVAVQVLADHAPQAADRAAALALARRLGYLPLALRIAGMHLRNMGPSSSFRAYQQALDHTSTGQSGGRHQPRPAGHHAVVAGGAPDLALDALAEAGFPQARPLLWLLACYLPASRIPEQIITGSGPSPWPPQWPLGVPHPLARLLDPRQAMPAALLAGHCRAGLRELCSAGLIQISKSSGGARVIEVHTAIAEAARAAMDTRSQPHEAPDASLIRETAASAICAMIMNLDTGSADHWPHFRVLIRHIEELLLTTAPHLSPRACRNLLHCMVLCAASYVWSKAEQLAEQLTAKAMTRASELGCHDQDVYQRLRHVHAQARREQGWAAEAEQIFQDILDRQLRLKDAAVRLDTLRTRQQLAWTKGRLGKWADAEAGLREVIRLQDERRLQLGEERAGTILRLHTQCMIHWSAGRQGRWAEAELGYRQLVTDREEILGPDHPDTLDARYNIGKALAWQGKWTSAENESHHTKTDRAQALGELHPDTLLARQLEHYANGYQAWQAGDRRSRRSAIAGLETVLAVQREKRGDNHRETLETRALLTALRGEYSPGMMWPEDLPRPGAD